MEALLKKWQAEADLIFREIQDINAPTAQVRRKLAKLTQLNECIKDMIQAICKEVKPTEPKGLHPVGTEAKIGDIVIVIDYSFSKFATVGEVFTADGLGSFINNRTNISMHPHRYIIIDEARQ